MSRKSHTIKELKALKFLLDGQLRRAKKVDKIKVSFTGEDNKPKTAEGTKGANGKWTVNNTDVRIDPNTGEITIPANKVKDLTEVTAVTKNGNGADSDPAKATAKDVQKPQCIQLNIGKSIYDDQHTMEQVKIYSEQLAEKLNLSIK